MGKPEEKLGWSKCL